MRFAPSLRGRSPKQPIFRAAPGKDGLLRCARNDAFFRLMLISFVLICSLAGRGACQTPPAEVKADPSISQLMPLELHSGTNDVIFWGSRQVAGPDVPFHQAGKIYEFETEGAINTYYATMQWRTPSYLLPLEDEIPPKGEDDGNSSGNYIGNMDLIAGGVLSNGSATILFQHVAFFQGQLNGKNQTFFVLARMQNTAPGDLAAWYRSRPVEIDIFAFSGGSDPKPGYNPPGFKSLTSFTTKYNYCDAEYAMLAVLPIVPSPQKQLHDLQAVAKPSLQKQTCRD